MSKICQIVFSGFGGHTDLALNLAKYFKKKKLKSTIIFYGNETLLFSYKQFCKKNNIEFFYINIRKKNFILAWRNLYLVIKKINPSLNILHTGTIFPLALIRYFQGVNLISVYHQSFFLKNLKLKLFEYFQYKISDLNIFLTKEYLSEATKAYGESNNKIIRNGISLEDYKKNTKKKKEKKIVFGMAGRFMNTKKHLLLIECFKNLNKNFNLELAGDGLTKKNCIKYVQFKKINNVKFLGYLNKKNLTKWIKNLDYYIHLTEGETLSLSILEAMAAKKAVIASDVFGVNNLIKDNFNGYLVKNNKKSVLNRLNNLLASKKNQNFITQNAYKIIKLKFNINNTFEAYYKVINKFI